jgi:hypothetical protein
MVLDYECAKEAIKDLEECLVSLRSVFDQLQLMPR